MEVTPRYRQRRVDCNARGGVRAELVPWADTGSRFTRDFEDQRRLRRIDELSYRRHHEYITCVADHVEANVVWAAEGKSAATVNGFFKALEPGRAAKLKGVTMDMSGAYIDAVERGSPFKKLAKPDPPPPRRRTRLHCHRPE